MIFYKNKKTIIILAIIIILIIFLLLKIIIKNKPKNNNEFLPEEEISEEQYRLTNIDLYFINKNTGEIQIEKRLIDVKELIKSPYNKLIELIILGGNNDELVSFIPKDTKINEIILKNNILIIDFSEEFLEIKNNENKNKIINIIENTLTSLIEINKIQINVNGEKIIF